MKTPTTKKKNGDSDPITLADDPQDHGESAAAAPLAAPVCLTFVRLSPQRTFEGPITIALADLAHVTIGASSGGPNGYGLISYQGRLFSQVGEFTGDDNPVHNPFIGFPVYVEL